MNEFVIKIQAPELAKAIMHLAQALSGTVNEVASTEMVVEVSEVVDKSPKEADEKPKTDVKPTKAKEEKVKEEAVKEEVVKEEDTKYTEVEVRAKFVELATKGKRVALKAMLDEFGVAKVSELKADQYADAMAQLAEVEKGVK